MLKETINLNFPCLWLIKSTILFLVRVWLGTWLLDLCYAHGFKMFRIRKVLELGEL